MAAEDPTGERERRTGVERVVATDSSPRFMKIARWVREQLPGDSELGDALSTAGDEPSLLLARRLSEIGAERPSVTRELGLGALQVWQALSEAQGRGHGDRDLAILFTDLVEFSSWALAAGDQAVLELLRQVGAVEEEAVVAHRGRVVKRLGDGMMAVFDDPLEAVGAAHEAVRAVPGVSVVGYTPALRAGVHFGRPRKLGGDYLGIDVNVASRIAGGAGAGQVLISGEVVSRLDPEAFSFKRRRAFRAKGTPKELEVFSVEPAV